MTLDDRDEAGVTAHVVSRRRAVALAVAALAGAAGLAGFGGSAVSRGKRQAGEARAHHHDGVSYGASDRYGPDSQHQALLDAASRCVAAGEVCLAHGSSVDAVAVMMVSCRAVAPASRFDPGTLKDAVALSARACGDCEIVCREARNHNAALQACADACAGFVEESRKLIG